MSDYNPILNAPKGANKKKRIVGRGSSSGRGTTAGRGNKGQQSRSGGKTYVGFEGGQTPLYRRIARKGFNNYRFATDYEVVNVCLLEDKYADGETVNNQTLVAKGLLKHEDDKVKILGNGDLSKKLTVIVDKVSTSAKEKIEKAGGSVSFIENKPTSKKIEKTVKDTDSTK